ncbi:MAG: geranylgeranylglycerol-phosphate geranylgeranyltransferase [Bacteroidota bacterium]
MLAYLKLFRWPNLLVVALTQYLFRYAIVLPVFNSYQIEPGMSHFMFFLLVLATLLITAAGYAINDYFDLRADRINKPEKIILGRQVSRRSAIFFHSVFNISGVLVGSLVAVMVGQWPLAIIFLVIPTLLWMYSIRYKKKYLIGNIIVSLLAGFVIVIVWIFDYHALGITLEGRHPAADSINIMAGVYALFAFLTTLAREIIKDTEDIRGDAKTGCRTIPIVSGIRATKTMIVTITISTIVLLVLFQVYLIRKDFALLFTYLIIAVQVPMIFMINKTITAVEKSDYKILSRYSKLTMVAGILSMVVFYFYVREGFSIIQNSVW